MKKTKNIILNESDEDDESPSEESISAAKEIENLEKTAAVSDDESKTIQDTKTEFNVSVKVSKYDLHMVDKALMSLRKAVKKYGMDEPIITIGKPYVKDIVFQNSDGRAQKHRIELQDISIIMDKVLKYAGNYTLVAVVDNLSGGSVLINNERCPSEYLKQTRECDGCGLPRIRYKIFVVRDENGQYKRFGGDCVQKYLGINPGKFINFLNFWNDYVTSFSSFSFDDDMDFGGKGFRGFSPSTKLSDINQIIMAAKEVLEKDARYIKKEWDYEEVSYGPSRKYRTNFGQATADKIENILYPDGGYADKFQKYSNMVELPLDMDFINGLKNFYNNLDTTEMSGGFGDFMREIKELFNSDQARVKDIGPIGYGVSFYLKRKESESKETKKPSEYVGKINEKMEFPWLKIKDFKTGEGQFGPWKMWSMEDKEGNVIKKWGELDTKFRIEGSNPDDVNLNVGDIVAFISEIKKHEFNNYSKQKETTIGRASMIKAPKVKKSKGLDEIIYETLKMYKLLN